MSGKMGLTTTMRKAVLKNQASNLLWYGKIEITLGKAKQLRSYVEKIITKAVNTYTDTIEVKKVSTNAKGKEVTTTVIKDGATKLAARRQVMAKLVDLQEIKGANESKAEYKARTADIAHPLIEKLFNEIAPKYAKRAEEMGTKGGYTRIIKLGERRGDAAPMALIELVD